MGFWYPIPAVSTANRLCIQHLPAVAAGTGDDHALPHLFNCLKDSQLSAAAFDAIYAIFMWHPDPEITALMNQACRMIPIKDAAVPLLDRIIQLQPEYYEVRLHWLLLHGISMLKMMCHCTFPLLYSNCLVLVIHIGAC